ncbi:MAG: DUF2207 domain-containing protein [Bacteroidia bacterium]|nr:DUF2207 domain-containing protein [Bacteroidia bacterium]
MKAKLTLALLLLAHIAVQAISFTKYADKLFKSDEYYKLIEEATFDVAKYLDYPANAFGETYLLHKTEIIEKATPFITKRFLWLENGYSTWPKPETESGKKRKQTYIREIQRGVRDALYADEEFLKSIFVIDETDRIISFHADINVAVDGNLTVVETIKIYNGNGGSNDEVKRGLVRSFPTHYKSKWGFVSTVPFNLLAATCNGLNENYKSKKLDNGISYYFGKADIILERGYYTYVLTYTTSKQIIFRDNNDELYWNVNGTGWSFTTGMVSCKIVFPLQTKITENNCYTGQQGATTSNCTFKIIEANVITFQTSQPLAANEGLTVSTTIAKGTLIPPATTEKLWSTTTDNAILPLLILAVLFLFCFNYYAWHKVGRDPAAGTIFPQFEPPPDFSPAACGFLIIKSYKSHHFAASLVDYAVNGLVDIEVKPEGLIFKSQVYTFHKPDLITNKSEIINQRYQWYGYYMDKLYNEKAEKGKYNATIASVYNGLGKHLKDKHEFSNGNTNSFKNLFTLNLNYVGWGIFFLVLYVIGTIVYFISYSGTPVLVLSSIALLLIGLVIQILFSRWLQAYSNEGRKILDHVLGFKMYVETAEQIKYDAMNPPDLTIQLFEKYLPYAIALECENQWASKFENVLEKAIEGGYQPTYFSMHGSNFNSHAFASGLSGGISSTIASASTPPSSSSGGSGGGGSSGGGGGGGGGGGW